MLFGDLGIIKTAIRGELQSRATTNRQDQSNSMQRYILFAGDNKYPAGGYDDYIGSRNSINALKQLALSCRTGGYKELPDWADIVDITTMGRLWSLRDKSEWYESDVLPVQSWRK